MSKAQRNRGHLSKILRMEAIAAEASSCKFVKVVCFRAAPTPPHYHTTAISGRAVVHVTQDFDRSFSKNQYEKERLLPPPWKVTLGKNMIEYLI